MGKGFGDNAIAIVTAIIGLATLSVVLSRRAETVNVIKAASGGLGDILKVVVSPITGGGSSLGDMQ